MNTDPPDKKLSKEDQALWDSFTEDMQEKDKTEAAENFESLLEEHSVEDKESEPERQKTVISAPPRQKQPEGLPQLDRRTEEKLRKGKMPLEGRIDLHGLTRDQAHEALISFIESSARQGKRCVLVITGKGKSKSTSDDWLSSGEGVLKQRTPQWLSSSPLNQYVLKSVPAQPKDGGAGALYVYLKRQR